MSLPEEGIQIAPVFVERLQSLKEEMQALERYFEAASNMYLKASERLLTEDRKLWAELLFAYAEGGINADT
jgi:CMP-N-acetylneuraminic acid synthetase